MRNIFIKIFEFLPQEEMSVKAISILALHFVKRNEFIFL